MLAPQNTQTERTGMACLPSQGAQGKAQARHFQGYSLRAGEFAGRAGGALGVGGKQAVHET